MKISRRKQPRVERHVAPPFTGNLPGPRRRPSSKCASSESVREARETTEIAPAYSLIVLGSLA
jgi:hypothetical protein